MKKDGKILIGSGYNGNLVYLLPEMAARHGIISGATGSGKTVCTKVLAEGFSDLGIPVFLTDIKGDLSGMIKPGIHSKSDEARLKKCGIIQGEFSYSSYPTFFWDAFGNEGHPVRTPVSNVDPILMAHLLELNDTQSDVLEVVYRISRKKGFILDDLKDLSAVLYAIAQDPDKYSMQYGRMSPQTVGVIQRQVSILEDRGGDAFFGRPEINILDWLRRDPVSGKGCINILNADRLFMNYHMYSAYLLWLLTEFNRVLPERGESEAPVCVLFLDEAQLLFKWCSSKLMTKIEQLIRMMRSKGVGIFLQTWSSLDIPAPVDRQLHNRIQLSMNAYTPLDQQNINAVSKGFPPNPRFDVYKAMTTLGIGEGIVTFLDREGIPGMSEKVTILPPQSWIGAITTEELLMSIACSPYRGVYDNVIDYYTAYEKLMKKHLPSIMDI